MRGTPLTILWVVLFAVAGWRCHRIARARRQWSRPRFTRAIGFAGVPVILLAAWWYCFYAPESMPLPLPPPFLSVWTLPLVHHVTELLLGWIGVALLLASTRPRGRSRLSSPRKTTQTPGLPRAADRLRFVPV